MKQKSMLTALFILFLCMMIGIFIGGSFPMFILSYIFVCVIMLFLSLYTAATLHARLFRAFIYITIMILQILYTRLITFALGESPVEFTLLKITSTVIIMLPFLIEKLLFIQDKKNFYMPSVKDFTVVTYAQLVHDKNSILSAVQTVRKAGQAFSVDNLSRAMDLISDQQSSFRYVNNSALTKEYFQNAYQCLDDEYVYVILTASGSPVSDLISVFTKRRFNHASLSFDRDLKTIVSYNGGQNVSLPGLNAEMIEHFFNKEDASIYVYRLKSTREQKKKMIEKIQDINREGSAYNLIGLVFKYSRKPNIMFCSQFVYQMLKHVGLEYFDKRSTEVRPSDLIELDYHRKLEFVYEIKVPPELKGKNKSS